MALNPFQQAISNLAKSLGLRGQAEQQVYQRPEFQQLLIQQFGNIPLPAGIDESMVVSRTPQTVEYKDAQGYIHRLERDINGLSPRLGQVQETSTNRPSVLPLGGGTNPDGSPSGPALTQLDPKIQGMFQQIFEAQNALQEDAFQKAQGTSVAQLVGNGVGASSIAGTIMSELLKGQSLARGQQQGNQNQALIDIMKFLTGVGTERDIAGANIDTQRTQIGNQNQQFYDNLQQQILQFQEQMRQAERQSLIDNIFKGVAVATGTAGGLSSAFSSKPANPTVSGGSYQAPPLGNPYGSLFGNYGGNVNA